MAEQHKYRKEEDAQSASTSPVVMSADQLGKVLENVNHSVKAMEDHFSRSFQKLTSNLAQTAETMTLLNSLMESHLLSSIVLELSLRNSSATNKLIARLSLMNISSFCLPPLEVHMEMLLDKKEGPGVAVPWLERSAHNVPRIEPAGTVVLIAEVPLAPMQKKWARINVSFASPGTGKRLEKLQLVGISLLSQCVVSRKARCVAVPGVQKFVDAAKMRTILHLSSCEGIAQDDVFVFSAPDSRKELADLKVAAVECGGERLRCVLRQTDVGDPSASALVEELIPLLRDA